MRKYVNDFNAYASNLEDSVDRLKKEYKDGKDLHEVEHSCAYILSVVFFTNLSDAYAELMKDITGKNYSFSESSDTIAEILIMLSESALEDEGLSSNQ